MKIGSWSRLGDVVEYLRAATGEEWLESAIISRLSEIKRPTIAVCIPRDWPLQRLESGQWKDARYSYPLLLQVGGIEQFLHELEIAGDARPRFLVSEAGIRFRTDKPIPRTEVLLSRDDIEQVLGTFDRLVEAMRRGEYPVLRALAMGEESANTVPSRGDAAPMQQFEAPAREAGRAQGPKKRQGDKWTDAQLQKLLADSNLPGMTHQRLADNYGVSRSRIGMIISKAKKRFACPKTAFAYESVHLISGRKSRRN
ncbi:hypothetical protein [Cupriavidus sp. CuC1]|uniref:hypothetical protein n=1 Tax=Cupriavidus sp. CuC1 TaxID=3373131 RepID=UPI0037D43192